MAVTIHLTANVLEVVQFLQDRGGDPRNVGEDYIEAYVPVSLLGAVSEHPGVIRVREIVPPQPAQLNQRVIGSGPAVHGSQAWNNAGFSGQGVKVGVIDLGFRGISGLQGTEVPSRIVARCYTSVGVFTSNLADCEQVSAVSSRWWPECVSTVRDRQLRSAEHGTWVAEAVLDMAPEAELYIAYPQSRGDLKAAADWMASQGVEVINHSVGWVYDGPGDGTSPLTVSPLNTVDRAVGGGVLWVNSAGNNAEETWLGSWSDPNSNDFLNFASNDEENDWPLRACRSYRVQLRWDDDWDGANTDLDLYVLVKGTNRFVAASRDPQSGESGQAPYESISFINRLDSNDLAIAVTHVGGNAPAWVQIVAGSVDPLQHHTLSGSIGNPAESASSGLLAAGAAPWFNVQTIEPFSSRGPTPDGRSKPDIVGADCGATALVPLQFSSSFGGNCGFAGTSQAAPHVAGLAALVKQANPSFTPQQVARYLKNNAADRGASGADNTWGYGFAQLPAPASRPPAGPAPAPRPVPAPRPAPTPTPVPTPSPASCIETITEDGTTDGAWAPGCQSQVQGRGYARYYTFTLAEQRSVTITLGSSDADSYLYLRSGDAQTGTVVAENDNHGTLLNTAACGSPSGLSLRDSCITIVALAAGDYTIEATTSTANAIGDFTLTVNGLSGSGGQPSTDPCGETIAGDGTTDGTWAADCQSQVQGRGYARYYTFTLAHQSAVTINLESPVDPYLYLRSGDARSGTILQENDDVVPGSNTNSRIAATLEAGSYTIEATTYNTGETGSFTLTVNGLSGSGGQLPTDACGRQFRGREPPTGPGPRAASPRSQTGGMPATTVSPWPGSRQSP